MPASASAQVGDLGRGAVIGVQIEVDRCDHDRRGGDLQDAFHVAHHAFERVWRAWCHGLDIRDGALAGAARTDDVFPVVHDAPQPPIGIAEHKVMVFGNADMLHHRPGFSDARPAHGQVAADCRIEGLVDHSRGDAIAVAGRDEDDVDLGAARDRVDGIARSADRLVIDVRRHDQDAIRLRRSRDSWVWLHPSLRRRHSGPCKSKNGQQAHQHHDRLRPYTTTCFVLFQEIPRAPVALSRSVWAEPRGEVVGRSGVARRRVSSRPIVPVRDSSPRSTAPTHPPPRGYAGSE